MELGERKLRILSAISEIYLKTGEPVGSKLLAGMLGNMVSSATVRNDMADLFSMGLLYQPHTSAGRIPSTLGLRVYIDRLMQKDELTDDEKAFVDSVFSVPFSTPESLVGTASGALADYTKCTSFWSMPSSSSSPIRQIELIKSGAHAIAIVLITEDDRIRTKICRTDFLINTEAMRIISRFVADNFYGKTPEEITPAYIQTLAGELGENTLVATPILYGISELAAELGEGTVSVNGESNLLGYKELSTDIGELFRLLGDSGNFLRTMQTGHKTVTPGGTIKVVIGSETQKDELLNTSILLSHYKFGDRSGGTIGLLGPARIEYAKVIPLIEYFTKRLDEMLLSEFLTEHGTKLDI